jgi:D-glycero-D-manno-heptose 1,7-bisphosphate phosphatase
MQTHPRFDLVLLDRDGVVNHDTGFVKHIDEWRPIAGSLEAIVALQRRNHQIAVCTNQSGVGRGLMTSADVDSIHVALNDALIQLGGRAVPVYYCPHAPDAGCECRKPEPGLLVRAMRELGGEVGTTCFVGDSERDLIAARRAGCEPVLVRSGNGGATERATRCHYVFDDLAEFAAFLGAE